jgi:uncharacterized protein (DUF1330 family)
MIIIQDSEKRRAAGSTCREVLDRAAVDAYNSQVQQAIKAAGGNLVIGEKIVAVLGDPPKRVCVTEFESLNKAEAWINSPERKALAPQRAVLRHGRAALDSF